MKPLESQHINLLTEQLLPIRRVPEFLKKRGARPPSLASVYRWCLHGIRGQRLQYLRVGGTIHTSAEAVARFAAAVTEAMEVEA